MLGCNALFFFPHYPPFLSFGVCVYVWNSGNHSSSGAYWRYYLDVYTWQVAIFTQWNFKRNLKICKRLGRCKINPFGNMACPIILPISYYAHTKKCHIPLTWAQTSRMHPTNHKLWPARHLTTLLFLQSQADRTTRRSVKHLMSCPTWLVVCVGLGGPVGK